MKKEKSCGAVVIKKENDELKFLIIRQTDGYWGFPKGHVEENETEEETSIREIKEETNIDVEIDNKFRKVITYSPKEGVTKDVVFFIGKAISDDLKIDPNELLEAKWVGVNEVKNYFRGEYGIAPAPVNKELEEKILGEGGQPVDCRLEDSKRTGEDFRKAKEALGDLAETEEDIMSYICFPAQAEKFLKDRKAEREKKVTYTIVEA